MGLAAAGVLGPVALGSLAKAVQKRANSEPGTGNEYWFYVDQPTPMFGLEDYERVTAELSPGTWYLAKDAYDEWVHVVDEGAGLEGWIAGGAVKRVPQ